MDILEAMIAWNPGGEADVVRWPDIIGASEGFMMTGGAAYRWWREGDVETELRSMLFTDFNTLTVRDGVDPQKVHEAFLKIDQYTGWISPDMRGAKFLPED